MKTISKSKTFIVFLIFPWMFIGWPLKIQEAQANPGVVLESSTESVLGTNGTNFTLNMPATRPDGDLYIAIVSKDDDVAFTTDLADLGWNEIYDSSEGGSAGPRVGIWWKIGSSEPASYGLVADSEQWIGNVFRFSGFDPTTPINTNNIKTSSSNAVPVFPAVTPTVDNSFILRCFGIDTDDVTESQTPAEHTWIDGGRTSTSSYGPAGYGAVSVDSPPGANTQLDETAWGSGPSDTYVAFSVVIAPAAAEASTTLGDGTDPSSSTVAPGSTNNYLDQFTFVTNTGTDSVTALTVTTANTTAIANVQIWDEAMTTQYFSTVSSPSGNNWNFSGGTAIPVSTSSASFRVVFAAKSHADLAEGTYGVTGTITSFTCTNTQDGVDADSATITIDNDPPSDATWGTITAGNQQVELNWSNPGDSDFYKVLILRKAGSAVTDVPTEGTEYSVPGIIGSSTIIYVNNGTSFTDTGLTNGTNYYYKIFAYDTYVNYASGSGTGPHTPQATLSISVSPLTWGVGTVDEGTIQMSISGNKIGVTNNGNVAETFILQIYDEDDRDEWTHSSLKNGAGNNIYVLSGIFCATTDSPTQTSFNETDSEDVLTTTQQTATSTKFAYAGGSANAVEVPVEEQRSLWLRLDMPTAVSGTYAYEQHTVTVRISCQQP